jgi:hypothetical protein
MCDFIVLCTIVCAFCIGFGLGDVLAFKRKVRNLTPKQRRFLQETINELDEKGQDDEA